MTTEQATVNWIGSLDDIEEGKQYEIVTVSVTVEFQREGFGEVVTADEATLLLGDVHGSVRFITDPDHLWDGDEEEIRGAFEMMLADLLPAGAIEGSEQWDLIGIRGVAE